MNKILSNIIIYKFKWRVREFVLLLLFQKFSTNLNYPIILIDYPLHIYRKYGIVLNMQYLEIMKSTDRLINVMILLNSKLEGNNDII